MNSSELRDGSPSILQRKTSADIPIERARQSLVFDPSTEKLCVSSSELRDGPRSILERKTSADIPIERARERFRS